MRNENSIPSKINDFVKFDFKFIFEYIKDNKGNKTGILFSYKEGNEIKYIYSKARKGDKFSSEYGFVVIYNKYINKDFTIMESIRKSEKFNRFIKRSIKYFKIENKNDIIERTVKNDIIVLPDEYKKYMAAIIRIDGVDRILYRLPKDEKDVRTYINNTENSPGYIIYEF